jgi:hypothetical protein
MVTAMLVDYISMRDENLLLENVRDFSLQVLARAIAAYDVENPSLDCKLSGAPNPTGVTCTPLAGGASYTVPGASVWSTFGGETAPKQAALLRRLATFLAGRRTPNTARGSCIYQAVSSLVVGSHLVVLNGAPQLCTLASPALASAVLGSHLQPFVVGGLTVPGVMQWNTGELLPLASDEQASLRFTSALTPQAGYAMLKTFIEKLTAATASIPTEVGALIAALGDLEHGLDAHARRQLLQSAVHAFKPHLVSFLDARVAPLEWCQKEEHSGSPACAVRVLTDAAYEPLMNAVTTPGSQGDAGRLARQLYLKLDELDPLGTTPLLFNIGPGVTMLTRFGSNEPTAHFTLLDKFGLAHRFGQRKAWEVGLFAGGFVDAIIRTAAEGEDADPYWLLGGTFGYRRFSPRYPFGFEVHVAAAMPFDTSSFDDKVAAAAGLNLIVPAELAFTE